MSEVSNLRQKRKSYVSRRFWILGALLLALGVLAIVQYQWIGRLAEAQRQREKANLSASLSNLESDFDIEITRVFVSFQVSFANSDYAERYKEWLQHAPYPSLIRGVYITEAGSKGLLTKAATPGEPLVPFTEWQSGLPESGSLFAGVAATAPEPGPVVGTQAFLQGPGSAALWVHSPVVTIEGNPAFVFPILPQEIATRLAKPARGARQHPGADGIVTFRGPAAPPRWALVVFDSDYIKTMFLPRLVNLYLQSAPVSDYEILIVNKKSATSSEVVFRSEAAPPENQFARADGRISLFNLRLDCFSPHFSANAVGAVGTPTNVRVISGDSLYDLLTRKPPTCRNPGTLSGDDPAALWEVLVKYRAGSLDEAMASFRRRNLLLSGSVLLVLALGISILVVLTERARALAQMQTEFVLGVSHELRTPLTVIRLAADNLKKGMVANSDQAMKYGEIIHSHASELSNMIEETLEVARMRSAALTCHRTLVATEQIVKDALADNETALRQASMEVELELPADLPPLYADACLVQRSVQNLIQNSVKYAAAGRWMAIRGKKVTRPEGERVQISIEDRGPGISPHDLPHIFEPFYRGKQKGSSQIPGVGLGLALVKQVVEAHQGAVEVETSGITRFSIFLPFPLVNSEARNSVTREQANSSH